MKDEGASVEFVMKQEGVLARLHSQRTAKLYDVVVGDWPGEIDFYMELAGQARARGQSVLEIGCGTGRVAIRLAQAGGRVVGLDRSADMLEVARRKSAGQPNLRWVEGDMRSFDLEERFGLAIIPGHAFQHMLTAQDQAACLATIRRHLIPGGRLVVHLDHQEIDWLGDLYRGQGTGFTPVGEFVDPETGHLIRKQNAWTYMRSTQSASVVTKWEEISANGALVDKWETDALQLHCVFPCEMEHALARTGFDVEAVYGDFRCGALDEAADEMIWVARVGAERLQGTA